MRTYLIPFFLFLFSTPLFSQQDPTLYYWIKFKDKINNGYSLNNPQQFLSTRSIERRAKQNIQLDSTDLPINQHYVDAINPYIGKLVHRLKWFNAVVVRMDDATKIDSIKALPFIDSIEGILHYPYKKLHNKFEDATIGPVDQHIIYPDIHGAAYHQLNMMNADLLHQMGYRGEGIIISMMDNGLASADVAKAFDSVRSRILDTWDFVHDERSVYGDGGHGLNTFSCIAANLPYNYVGTGPDASFYLLETEDNDAEWIMEEYNWAAAAEFADSGGAQIFSTSLGYETFDTDEFTFPSDSAAIASRYADLTGNKTVITQAGNIAASKGILVFSSAGNAGEQPWHFVAAPGDGDSIITVGAVDSARVIGAFSSRGPNAAGRLKPDLCAEGSHASVILSNATPVVESGTSFSCPILAGCAASLWSAFPDKSAKEIKDAIMISADRFWNPDNNYGYGIPNFYNAYLFLKTNYSAALRISDDVTAYPNPFTGELNIALYNAAEGSHDIALFDLLGHKIFSKQIYIRNKTFELITPIETGTMAEGEYILQLDGKLNFTHRVMKVKP